MKTGTVCR